MFLLASLPFLYYVSTGTIRFEKCNMVPPAAPLEYLSAVPILMYTPLGQAAVPISSASRSRYGISGPTGVTGVDQTGGLKRWKLIKVEEEVKQ